MKKAEFLQELEERLHVLNDQERQDVLDEYVQHIDMKTAAGMSEEEAVGDFGNLDELITDLLDAYHVNSEYATGMKGRVYQYGAAEDAATGREAGSNSENFGSAAGDMGYGFGNAAPNAGWGPGSASGEAARGLGNAAENAGRGFGGAAENAGHGLGNAAKNVGHGLGSAAKTAGHGLGNAAKNVGHGLGSAAKTAGHGLGSAAKTAGHGLGSVAKTAGRGAGSAAKASGRGLRHVAAGMRVLLKKGAQAVKQLCLACWNMTKRAGKAAEHAARSLWGLFVRFLLWIASVVRGACSAVKRGVQRIFHGRGQEQRMSSAEACGQDPDETGGAQTRSLLYRMAAWIGRTLRKLCIWCAKAVLLMAVLPVLILGLIALFIAGTAVVLLVQGYPVVGITVAVFGAVLCLFGISALVLSFVFTGKRAKHDAAGATALSVQLSDVVTAEPEGRNQDELS